MIRLLVLGSNRSPNSALSNYRGTYRSRPDYQVNLDPQHEVNLAFEKFCEQGGQSLVLSDITFARYLVQLYQLLEPPQNFDIIEAVGANSSSTLDGRFIGYDVSLGTGHSLLYNGLNFDKEIQTVQVKYKPLINLLRDYFKPKLNSFGLFDDLNIAQGFLQCCTCINDLEPAFFWSKNDRYEVIALHVV